MAKKWLVGLGNPGPKYLNTRHNAGFMALSRYAKNGRMGDWKKEKNEALWLRDQSRDDGVTVTLLLPQTFMNDSGRCLLAWKAREGLDPKDLLVVTDDMDLPVGKIRYRASGSGGSHNGMASVIACLGSKEFARLRLGIGKPERPEDWPDYVLRRFAPDDAAPFEGALERACEAMQAWVEGMPKDRLMSKFNA
jgi:PTH1 family peptidyl-tRNA hydrolase